MSEKAQAFDEQYGEQFKDFLYAATMSTDMLEALGAMSYGESQVRLDAFMKHGTEMYFGTKDE
jgi:hypothetical protein